MLRLIREGDTWRATGPVQLVGEAAYQDGSREGKGAGFSAFGGKGRGGVG
jgi:hypothetical protein